MIYSGELPTSPGTLYTVPLPTPGVPNSGAPKTINFFRVVNESGVARTFTLFLNVNGTARAITPIATQLPIGAAYDDIPTFQMAAGAEIIGDASAAGVSWTINSY